jgi:hypothetical protein
MVAANWYTYACPTCPPTECTVEAGKAYSEAVAEKGKGHGLGAPHAHTLTSFMEAILKNPENIIDQQTIRAIQDIMEQFETGGIHMVTSCVPHFRCKPMYQKDQEDQAAMDTKNTKYKVEIGIDPFGPFKEGVLQAASFARAMEAAILQLKGSRLVGPPPKGPLERHLGKLLDKLKKETDKYDPIEHSD